MSERPSSPISSLDKLTGDRGAVRKELAKLHDKLDMAIELDGVADEHRSYLRDIKAQLRSQTETFLAQASSVEWQTKFRGYIETIEDEIKRVLYETKGERE